MTIQVGRDQEVSSPTSSQSRIGYGVRSGCAGLYPDAVGGFSAQEGQVSTVRAGCEAR